MGKREDQELAAARQAAYDNLRRNAARDQALYERRVDIAEKLAKTRKGR